MVMKPGLQGIVWALPGMMLSGFALLVSVAGFATGMPFTLAAQIFGIAVALGILWVPVILYLIGTRLALDHDRLELTQLFGLRVRRLPRRRIGRIAVSVSGVALIEDFDSDVVGPTIPIAYYDVIDADGRRWTRLRSWLWNRSDCERLRGEVARLAQLDKLAAPDGGRGLTL